MREKSPTEIIKEKESKQETGAEIKPEGYQWQEGEILTPKRPYKMEDLFNAAEEQEKTEEQGEASVRETISGNEKKITIKRGNAKETKTGNVIERKTSVEAIAGGYTGAEVLSENYMEKLKTDSLGYSLANTLAGNISRSLSAKLAQYEELKSKGEEEKAEIILKNIHKSVKLYDKRLGEGVIDHSKIPGLE